MTNILRPELVWIEGRCYRINEAIIERNEMHEHDLYESEETYEMDHEGDDDDFEVVMVNKDEYNTSFHVSKHYIGSIIGKKGATKMRIEQDTRTQIKIPRQGQTGNIVILGRNASNVKAARRRINMIVVSSRMKQRPTHFLSIPFNQPAVVDNFIKFKESVLSECTDRGIEESIFQKPHKLHLTMGVMCLMDNEERLEASKLLTEAKDNIIMPMIQAHLPLKLRLKGLSYMNDDPKEIHVLFGNVQEDGIGIPAGLVQNLADSLVDHFYKAGFMDNEYEKFGREHVKLHVTLLNSRYRESTSNDDSASRRKDPRVSFDGSGVLQKFKDYDFGVVEVNNIHISQMHATDTDGYYPSTCIVSFT